MMTMNPLEQFTIYPVSLEVTLTNNVILLGESLIIISILLTAGGLLPTGAGMIVESWIASGLGIVRGSVYLPGILAASGVVLFANLLGMIPYSFTPTSHGSVTLGVSLAIMIGLSLQGMMKSQLMFFSLFLPSGTPTVLVPLLVGIEFISFTARAFSLALRLTANVSAGHCLFGVISQLGCNSFGASLLGAGPLIILVPLYALELLVALLQTYVFTLLVGSYLADIENLSH